MGSDWEADFYGGQDYCKVCTQGSAFFLIEKGMNVLVEMAIQDYEHLSQLEAQICRLLRSKRPACLSTEAYWQFRCHLLLGSLDKQTTLHMPQGLIARAFFIKVCRLQDIFLFVKVCAVVQAS